MCRSAHRSCKSERPILAHSAHGTPSCYAAGPPNSHRRTRVAMGTLLFFHGLQQLQAHLGCTLTSSLITFSSVSMGGRDVWLQPEVVCDSSESRTAKTRVRDTTGYYHACQLIIAGFLSPSDFGGMREVLGINPRVTHTGGMCSTTELHPQASCITSHFEIILGPSCSVWF